MVGAFLFFYDVSFKVCLDDAGCHAPVDVRAVGRKTLEMGPGCSFDVDLVSDFQVVDGTIGCFGECGEAGRGCKDCDGQ